VSNRKGPGTVRGHLEALAAAARRLLEPPMTFPYPDYEEAMPPRFRGVVLYDYDKCIGCSLCAQVCPARAIKMYRVPGDKRLRPGYNPGRCIFCGLCTDICPTDALWESRLHEHVTDAVEEGPPGWMDPVDWHLWSLKVSREEERRRGRMLAVVVDEERGLRYVRVSESGGEPGE